MSESTKICGSVLRLCSLVHTVNVQIRAGRCEMQEIKHFSERDSSIRVTVGNVNLFSYLVMHVETDIFLTSLGKCMLVCFFLMDCAVWVVG